ncbi:MAG: hypothetical protein A2792_10255 [Sphingomonadales bacterium RIFCSPHIGHO2_01_FULL_65_20]|uniref:hypothetical protein n=1 Tax=Blastomonas sp. TaxID=1909299 RepID=UPI0008C1C441|nr:hypothetical protein [Blastomonas sp.]OHC93186.1 MAG: hypothetical protein A2792_10255 [Sphingomonadales bacterium RIFCSPHIGHO2_01_FULL_65_20]
MTRQSSDLLSLYIEFIQWTGDGTGLPDTILHIHAGMAVLLLARLLTRKSLGSLVPLAFVVVAELGNEIMDRLHYGSWRWPDTSMDVLNTLLWPAVLSLAIRLRPPVTRRR